MYETILYEIEDGVATITLNRPEKLNAYVHQMGVDIVDAFSKIRDDDAVRAVVLTGAGRAFCAGVDLDALKSGNSRIGEEHFVKGFARDLVAFPKPVLVAINGHAIGVGVTMALPCDLRIAAAGAKLGVPFAKLGILPGLGSTHLLPRIVGVGRALELLLTARLILAEEALEMGLVNKVVAPEALMDEARATARLLAGNSPEALALIKRGIHFGAHATLEQAMAHEQQLGQELREGRSG